MKNPGQGLAQRKLCVRISHIQEWAMLQPRDRHSWCWFIKLEAGDGWCQVLAGHGGSHLGCGTGREPSWVWHSHTVGCATCFQPTQGQSLGHYWKLGHSDLRPSRLSLHPSPQSKSLHGGQVKCLIREALALLPGWETRADPAACAFVADAASGCFFTEWRKLGGWGQVIIITIRAQTPVPPVTSCVTLGMPLNLSVKEAGDGVPPRVAVG